MSQLQNGILLLDKFLASYDLAIIHDAHQQLQQAVRNNQADAAAYAALGFTYEALDQSDNALAAFRTAYALAPDNEIYQACFLILLAENAPESEALPEIESAALHRHIDLNDLRAQFDNAGWTCTPRDLVSNGFIHGRNWFRSWIQDEAERIRNAQTPGRAKRIKKEELQGCAEFQRTLQAIFDETNVPPRFHELCGPAAQYGIGDDVCRPMMLRRMPKREYKNLVNRVDALAAEIDRWLDTFPTGKMSVEAAAFMYLLSGIEETRERPDGP